MNNKKTRALLLAIPLGVAFLAGCELIVDFDRTRIPADATDSSVAPKDAQSDTAIPDAAPGVDAATDAPKDAPTTDAADASLPDSSDAGSTDAADASD